ncbi:hypothetical protein Tco_0920645 [Tanacetum coccineum]
MGFRFGLVSFSSYTKGDMIFRDRVFPHGVGLSITSLDLIGVIEDEEYFSKLCDIDVVRVCLLLCLEVIFMGRLLVNEVDDTLMRLVGSLESWNAFPLAFGFWSPLKGAIVGGLKCRKLYQEESKPIFDLRPTLAEYQSEWWTITTDFLQDYVPRTPMRKPDLFDAYPQKVSAERKRNRFCRNIITSIPNVRRSEISSLKDRVIKELNSRFSDEFCHLSGELCDELNHDFLELFDSNIFNSLGTSLDGDTSEEIDEVNYTWTRLEEEERLLLEEKKVIQEEKRLKLEEQKRLKLEEERSLEIKKRWEEEYKKRSYAFMNSDHMKQAMARCAPKKRTHFLPVRTSSWLQLSSKFQKKKQSFGLVDRDRLNS